MVSRGFPAVRVWIVVSRAVTQCSLIGLLPTFRRNLLPACSGCNVYKTTRCHNPKVHNMFFEYLNAILTRIIQGRIVSEILVCNTI